MQPFNHEARAICFWGLHESFSFIEPGPLQGYADLQRDQMDLSTAFEGYLYYFSQSPWSIWPSRNGRGTVYKLSDSDLFTLLEPMLDADEKQVLMESSFRPIRVRGQYSGVKPMFRLSQIRLWLIGAQATPSD